LFVCSLPTIKIGMSEQQQQFQWGELGEKWWCENGAACRCTEHQIKYAASRHQGANKSKAATLAGYSGSPEALRSAGVRADGTKGVEDLLTLAGAAEDGGSKDGPATPAEIDRKLTKLIRSPDGAISLKAIEAMERREERRRQRDTTSEFDLSDDEVLARTFMSIARPEGAPIIWAELVLVRYHWHSPFLRELVPWFAANRPADWAVFRKILIGEYGQMLDNVVKLESGPVLSLDEIVTRCGLDFKWLEGAEKPSGNGAQSPDTAGEGFADAPA
jgi:hypothetical protein